MVLLKSWAFFLSYFSTAIAKSIHELESSLLACEKPQGLSTPLTSSYVEKANPGVPDSIALIRRNDDFTIWRARPLSMIHPVQIAATALDAFYTTIFNEATHTWLLQSPKSEFWIRAGRLNLFFYSFGGPIPWDLVARFAWKLRSATRLGWVGTYDLIYLNGPATRSVSIILKIVEQAIGSLEGSLLTSFDWSHKMATSVSPSKRALARRDIIVLTFAKVYGTILPIALAAEKLRDFFTAIAREASSTWTSNPTSALFTITQGPIQLTVSCLGSTIPWEFLALTAREFANYADRLFVNTFDAFYTEIASKVSIGFSLRIVEAAMRLAGPSPRSFEHVPPKASPPTPLKRRANNLPSLTMTKFIPSKMICLLPSALAASRLEDFYNIIALKIETGYFDNWQPSKNIILSLFEFELSITCSSIDIPWSFVQSFAIDMAEWSSKTFSGLYEATIRGDGPLTNLVFTVAMRLKDSNPGEPPPTWP